VTKNYAQAGTINVNVNTSVAGVVSPSFAPAVTIVNAGMPTGTLTFTANPPSGASSFALVVYPFTSGYGVWAGGCSTANPTLYGQAAQTATPAPGGSATVVARQPAIDLTVKRQGVLYASSNVWITNTDAGCGTAVQRTSNASGKLADPGFPYGHYTVCADDTRQFKASPVIDTNPAGTALTVDIPKKAGGTCP
jgi:hypothetical protein